ncbi:DUF1194 domain-containing protein [Brevirhabdus sp.]|uniref:DUF1194 domain-containing protein n=1 Tax=Brevirhabdus sp. TaxID=2004514 RepID=UPI00405843A2
MNGRTIGRALVAAVLVFLTLASTGGAAQACRLALVLALDVSSSVDSREDALQRQGLAAALLYDPVRRAVLDDPANPVALAVFEWSGRDQQQVILDWTLLRSEAALRRAAGILRASRRGHSQFPTAAGYALGYAASVFATAPDCLFRTLDVSGDGINNAGFSPALAYANFPLDGITVNALAILGGGKGAADDAALLEFYRKQILRGPGAFLEVAANYEDFERAIRRKLEREIRAKLTGRAPTAPPSGTRRSGGTAFAGPAMTLGGSSADGYSANRPPASGNQAPDNRMWNGIAPRKNPASGPAARAPWAAAPGPTSTDDTAPTAGRG